MLVVLRMFQGLALGGEYGGAATYVAEHAPNNKRGLYTSWIQITATAGLAMALLIVITVRSPVTGVGEDAFKAWGWRVPYLLSGLFLVVGLWLRLKLHESPVFQKMKSEGTASKAPLTEAFGEWKNLKVVLIAFFGAIAGQAVIWYTGQLYAMFFLEKMLKVDGSGQHPDDHRAADGHAVLPVLRLAVGQDRPQADHPRRRALAAVTCSPCSTP
jgi:MFS family permease